MVLHKKVGLRPQKLIIEKFSVFDLWKHKNIQFCDLISELFLLGK